MFLYLMGETPEEIIDALNQIVREANRIGIDVVSEVYTLKGDYATLGSYRIRDATYGEGVGFSDGTNSDLVFPPLVVEDDRVFEMDYRSMGLKNPVVEIPKGFNSSRFITKKLIGIGKRFLAPDTCVEGVRLVQYFQTNPSNRTIYIPHTPSCQNIVDGPLIKIGDGNVVAVDWSKIFRTYSRYSIFKKSLEESLRDLFVL